MKISVVIPAHNEEKYIARCLASINAQQVPQGMQVEIIVVLNRCTDKTKEIALSHGAIVVSDDSKNLSAIKNTGVAHATTEWVITIDADSWMSKGVLAEIYRYARSPNCLGGGIRIKPERSSLGIAVGYGMLLIPAFFLGLSFGMYWFRKSDFDAIGGFDEKRHIAEDVDFLKRLKQHGRSSGRKHKIISATSIITSCRKFDEFGDWHFVRIFSNPCRVRQAIVGNDRNYLDKNWYEVKR
ncbi:glycosyltransferase [Alteromonas sp. 1_MG-2023]|uniref:glycosyltransferase n=1 Tax=Alteromonas sp. 1_MG-2023 TaxID=3062669 RepID=UPI0026E13163|nr:glycosyltransferase [Alteromonas sp. 1_MG-2023]MDO6477911.1 glycosyltransferase [Alteromonas sp. 1_MG-2023]